MLKKIKNKIFCLGLCLLAQVTFAQSVNANFEVDEEGWTPHFTGYPVGGEETYELSAKWSKMISPLNQQGGISFSGKNYSKTLFLYIQKEINDLLPNTNYQVMFNMDWLCRMEPSAAPITVKIGVSTQEPELSESSLVEPSFKKGEIGKDGRDFSVIGTLKPNEFGYPFQQNMQNYDKAFLVNTDDEGRLFLMIGVEPENDDVADIFLNTLRVVLAENGEAREISNISSSSVIFYPNMTNDVISFESDYNSEIEMVNIYTADNHLIKIYTFRDPFANRAFYTTDLLSGVYRIEFVLQDGRTINKSYTVE